MGHGGLRLKTALFTTITPEHWRRALPMARARRRERRAALARQIRAIADERRADKPAPAPADPRKGGSR